MSPSMNREHVPSSQLPCCLAFRMMRKNLLWFISHSDHEILLQSSGRAKRLCNTFCWKCIKCLCFIAQTMWKVRERERDDKIYPERTYTPVETAKLKSLNCIPNKKECLLSTYSVSCSETSNPAILLSKGTCSLVRRARAHVMYVKKGIQETEKCPIYGPRAPCIPR